MIQTERLTLRRVLATDWQAIQAIWADAAQSEYAQYDRPNDTSDDAVFVRIEKWAAFKESMAHMFWAVCLKDQVIGYVSMHQRGDAYEIGYCFHSAYHGKGYARESIGALLQAFKAQGICRFTAGTALNNHPSTRLLTALGFQLTGTEQVTFYQDAQGNDIYFDGGIFELNL